MNRLKQYETLSEVIGETVDQFPEISLIYLFGSQIDGQVGPLSDYDFGVLIDHPESGPYVRSRLSSALSHGIGIDRIDIVLLDRAPIELTYTVISHGELLYQRDNAERIEYEARVMGLYFDYLPVLRSQRDDILRGGGHETRIHRCREALGRTERTLIEIRASQK